MAAYKTGKPKPIEWSHDHRRVIDGEPFSTHGWTDAQRQRHSGVRIPEPVSEREFFPGRDDIYPTGNFELRVVDGQGYWFDIRYAERANMREFKRKPDSEPQGSEAIRAYFSAPQRKDLA